MGCNSCGEEKIIVPVSTCCDSAQVETPACQSFSGKFYDKTIADFTVPGIGKVGGLTVCQANLWAKSQYVGVVVGKSKYAFFRIVDVGQQVLKVLNGCTKNDPDSPILGNPEPGIVLPEGSVIFPCPPVGCSDQLAEQFASLLENFGAEGVIKILKESDEICFTATPEISDEEVTHLFGGTMIDCDCAPEASSVLSCLRKLLRIFTGQSGKTLCFPDVGTTSIDDVTVDEEEVSKYLAYFDENGCLKKGAKAKDVADNHWKYQVENTLVVSRNQANFATDTLYWDSLNIPDVVNGRQIYAELEIVSGLAGVGDTPPTLLQTYVNSGLYFTLMLFGPGNDRGTRTIRIPATAGGSFTVNEVHTNPQPGDVAFVQVTLIGYLV